MAIWKAKSFSMLLFTWFAFSSKWSIHCTGPDINSLLQKQLQATHYALDTMFDVWVIVMN